MARRRIGPSHYAAAAVAVSGAIALLVASAWAPARPREVPSGTAALAGNTVTPSAASSPARSTGAFPARSTGASPTGGAGARRVTFVNAVSQTIWVAASPDKAHPLAATGWVLPPGHSVTIIVPNHWNGRFWGRTGCVFRHGLGHCQTGDCNRRLQCAGWGTIPATLAEYNLDAWSGLDFYDVSMVDGANLPMYINVIKGHARKRVSASGCIPAGCTKPVDCPSALAVEAGGVVVACQSACARFGTDQYCCRGPWAPRSQCNPAMWPVDYAAVFKRAEPYAYSYVDDDATSVYVCSGGCDYRIVFGVTPRR